MRKALLLAVTITLLGLAPAPATSAAATDGVTTPEQPPFTWTFEGEHLNTALDEHTVYPGMTLVKRFTPDPRTWPWVYYTWTYGDDRPANSYQICNNCQYTDVGNWFAGSETYRTPGSYIAELTMWNRDRIETHSWSLPTITVLPDTDVPVFKVKSSRQKPGQVRFSGYIDEHQSGLLSFQARAIIRTANGKWMAQRNDTGWVKAPNKATAWRRTYPNRVDTTWWAYKRKNRPSTGDHARNLQSFTHRFVGKVPAGEVTVRLSGDDLSGQAAKTKMFTVRIR